MPKRTLWSIRFRRILQLTVFFLFIISPFAQFIRTYHQVPYPYPNSPLMEKNMIMNFAEANDQKVRNFLEPIYNDLSGGPYTMNVFGIHFSEPMTPFINAIQIVARPDAWNWVLFTTLLICTGIAVLFGRVYCGYICPMSVFVSWNLKIQKKLFNRSPQYSGLWRSGPTVRKKIYFLFFLFLLLNPVFIQYVLPPALMQHALSDYILFGGITLWVMLLGVVVLFEVALPGLFCRKLCPTGNFISTIGKKRLVHLDYGKGIKCQVDCNLCNDACWLGLKPRTKAKDPACDLCQRCVSKCPTGRLKFLSIAIAVFLSLNLSSYASQPSNFPSYLDDTLEIPLFETERKISLNGTSTTAFVTITGTPRAVQEGGVVEVYLHIIERVKTKNEPFMGPVKFSWLHKDKVLKEEILETVNAPISILKRSVYEIEVPFKIGEKYTLNVSSPDQRFEAFDVKFRYPLKRR